MRDLENFKKIYKEIFEEDVLYQNLNLTNNCIGALNKSQYTEFNTNFINRLIRLKNKFQSSPEDYQELKNTVKDIGNKKGYKWSGPYSELVALDYWTSFKDLDDFKFVVKGDVNLMPNSLAKKIGQETVDLDLSFNLRFKKIYMDVKSFIPTHFELIDRIIEEVEKQIPNKDFLIGIEHLNGGNYLSVKSDIQVELKNRKLIDTLVEAINNDKAILNYSAISGNIYKFRMAYPSGNKIISLTTEDTFDPYEAAENNKFKGLDYYNKLLVDDPSLLTFVINPWFNREAIGSNLNETFYRAFSRRIFIEFKNCTDDISSVLGIKVPITQQEISEKISGIVFIVDNSVLQKGENLYKTYIYLNPNATNYRLTKGSFDILNWSSPDKQPEVIEDFEFDNY